MNNDTNTMLLGDVPAFSSVCKTLKRVFRHHRGALAVRLWSGETICVGQGEPEFTLVFKDPHSFRDLVFWQNPLQLVRAYFLGRVDVEGQLYRALNLRYSLGAGPVSIVDRFGIFWRMRSLPSVSAHPQINDQSALRGSPMASAVRTHSRRHNAGAIAFHYDLSNDFYRLWLDQQMVYSCGYFEDPGDSLEVAQRNKLDHICRKLRLKPGEEMLDVGCGWGALAIWAAKNYGVNVTAVTLSSKQFEFAQRRIYEEGLQERVSIKHSDYRDIDGVGRFDKVASVGMFEHVGLKNLPIYFGKIAHLLKPGGLFLNHGITHDEEGWRATLTTKFINRFVFPDGELDTVSNVQREMERAKFEIWDVESLRPHYAITLRHWVSRLEAARAEALQYVDDATYRVWRLYMAACALHFEDGDVSVYQILASKRAPHVVPLPVPVPMTRRDLYN
jgi:cyclopropane-fatty-acyl-phospholipid synthase